jgi:hypothetical protein
MLAGFAPKRAILRFELKNRPIRILGMGNLV